MKEADKPETQKKVTRRSFLKMVFPGLCGVGLGVAARTDHAGKAGAYGNGPYGGTERASSGAASS